MHNQCYDATPVSIEARYFFVFVVAANMDVPAAIAIDDPLLPCDKFSHMNYTNYDLGNDTCMREQLLNKIGKLLTSGINHMSACLVHQ